MKRAGFKGTATMKIISKTNKTSISGVTLMRGLFSICVGSDMMHS